MIIINTPYRFLQLEHAQTSRQIVLDAGCSQAEAVPWTMARLQLALADCVTLVQALEGIITRERLVREVAEATRGEHAAAEAVHGDPA